MESAAERLPEAAGLNVTLMLQLAPLATVDPQVVVCEKSPALAPPILMPDRLKLLPPVFDRVMDWAVLEVFTAWLAKLRLAAERLTVGGAALPVPDRETL
jgi:hypothetical protein